MKGYVQVFVNFAQNNKARLFLMAEFAYNNGKNASTSHRLFELNYKYHLYVLYKENVNPYTKSKVANKLS